MPILLPKKTNQIPVACDDDHYDFMAADPSIPQIPQGSSFGSVNYTTTETQTVMSSSASSTLDTGFNPGFGNMNPQFNQNLTQAGNNAARDADILVENTNTEWINKKWRPLMGWMYMTVCVFDFILFPVMWAVIQFWETQAANDAFRQWQPLTLQGAGLFHIAMGTVLGITAYGRTREKVEGKS